MRIGFFGNTNNYPFILARALMRMGQTIRFIVTSKNQLDRPETRYKDISLPYPEWIIDEGNFIPRECVFPTFRRARIVRMLRQCDAVVYNGCGPALSKFVQRPAVILLTGSDLDYYANPATVGALLRESKRWPAGLRRVYQKYLFTQLVSAQRSGIRNACVVNYLARGTIPVGDSLLDDIGVNGTQRVFLMMSDLEEIRMEPLACNDPVRLFCATRFTWRKPIAPGTTELDYKGSDIMIKGLGLFHRRTGIRLEIRLVKKGRHVAEAMELVDREGLSNQVRWLEEMSQAEVLKEFRQADIVLEQFGQSMVGMAGLDAMAMGRPVIANGRPEIMEPAIGAPSSICQARTPEEVYAQLERLVPDPVERERVGIASRKYVERYFSADRAAEIFLEHLSRCL